MIIIIIIMFDFNKKIKFEVEIDYCASWGYMKQVNMIKEDIENVYP